MVLFDRAEHGDGAQKASWTEFEEPFCDLIACAISVIQRDSATHK
jgi:hypothetical protein